MKLPVDGWVTRVSFDFAITLLVSDGSEFRFETPFEFCTPEAGAVRVVPEDSSSAVHVIRVLRVGVREARVSEDGELRVFFDDGISLVSSCHELYEAWGFVGADRSRAIAQPGGGTTTWGPK